MKGIGKLRRAGTLFRKGETPDMHRARLAERARKASGSNGNVQSGENRHDESRFREQPTEDSLCLGSRLADLGCLVAMMNTVLQGHQRFPAPCEAAQLVLYSEWRVGAACELQFTCTTCGFVSPACRTSGHVVPTRHRAVAEPPTVAERNVHVESVTESPASSGTSKVTPTVGEQPTQTEATVVESYVFRELSLRSKKRYKLAV